MKHIKIKEFKFSGIKNIEKEMTINFLSKSRKTTFEKDLDTNFIKAIYGPNGTGKTAIIEAMKLYNNIININLYLNGSKELLKSLINETVNEINLEVTFTYIKKKVAVSQELKHKIKIIYNKEKNNFNIIEEEIYNNDNLIVEVKNGEIKNTDKESNLYNKTLNLLKDSSISSLVKNDIENFGKKVDKNKDEKIDSILNLLLCFNKIRVIDEEKDNHFSSIVSEMIENKEDKNDEDYATMFAQSYQINHFGKKLVIDNKIYEENKKYIEQKYKSITEFLKIFKPQVEKIELEKVEKEKTIEIKSKIIYIDGTIVDIEYESVGIKKLIYIYEMIDLIVNHESIIFIDELDAHLHDVAINKILQYIIDKEEGQLLFVTHNVSIMEKIKYSKNSINIIDLNQDIHTWKQKGNYSPATLYKKGYLTEDFNYGVFDFEKIFLIGENNE